MQIAATGGGWPSQLQERLLQVLQTPCEVGDCGRVGTRDGEIFSEICRNSQQYDIWEIRYEFVRNLGIYHNDFKMRLKRGLEHDFPKFVRYPVSDVED